MTERQAKRRRRYVFFVIKVVGCRFQVSGCRFQVAGCRLWVI